MVTAMIARTTTRARLDTEWARLRTRSSAVRRASAWHLTERPPTTLDDIVAAVGGGGDRSEAADQRLRRLVAIARRDDLAGRVVIERLIPGLLALARRHRDDPDAFEELLAAAWISVRTFNPSRTPANLAASLLSDADYEAYRRRRRRRESDERPAEFVDVVVAESAAAPCDELADLLGRARREGMPTDDLDLIRRLISTPRTEDVAKQLDVTPRTIRNRRARVTKALRKIALAA